MLVYKLQTHFKYLRDINNIGVIEELKHLSDASGIRMSGFLHERLGGLAELFLRTTDTVLVRCLDQRDQYVRVYLNIAGVDKLEKAFEDLRLYVRYEYLLPIPFYERAIEHLREDIRATRQYLPMCLDPLLVGSCASHDDNV